MLVRGASYNCETCRANRINFIDAEGRLRTVTEAEYEGCENPPLGMGHVTEEGQHLERCPKAIIRDTEWWPSFEDAWYWREHGGCWPIGNGWMEQAAIFLDALKYLNGELTKYGRRTDNNR